MSAASRVFRIIYRFFYLLLYFILVLLLVIIPVDVIRQALRHERRYNVIIIALAYFVTIVIVGFVYATRLYINRSVLASIPKSWIPIESGDVNKQVRKMIVTSLSRSAAIAYDARPRVSVAPPVSQQEDREDGQADQDGQAGSGHMVRFRLKKVATVESEMGINLPPHKPVWGEIEHAGWASPHSPDLPNLQYGSVISELPNLIEAKALTLAPSRRSSVNPEEAPVLDPGAVSMLQRSENLGLRDYLAHLTELGVLAASQITADFVNKYEYARFSTRPISNARFRDLMHLFAEILRNMQPLDLAAVAALDDDASSGSDIDDDAPMRTNPSTPRTQPSSRAGAHGVSRSSSSSTVGSRPKRPALTVRNSSANTWQYKTAPTTPKSRRTAISRNSSANTFAQTRHPYPVSQASSSSLRSAASGGSVIRLSQRPDSSELPYVLTLTDTL